MRWILTFAFLCLAMPAPAEAGLISALARAAARSGKVGAKAARVGRSGAVRAVARHGALATGAGLAVRSMDDVGMLRHVVKGLPDVPGTNKLVLTHLDDGWVLADDAGGVVHGSAVDIMHALKEGETTVWLDPDLLDNAAAWDELSIMRTGFGDGVTPRLIMDVEDAVVIPQKSADLGIGWMQTRLAVNVTKHVAMHVAKPEDGEEVTRTLERSLRGESGSTHAVLLTPGVQLPSTWTVHDGSADTDWSTLGLEAGDLLAVIGRAGTDPCTLLEGTTCDAIGETAQAMGVGYLLLGIDGAADDPGLAAQLEALDAEGDLLDALASVAPETDDPTAPSRSVQVGMMGNVVAASVLTTWPAETGSSIAQLAAVAAPKARAGWLEGLLGFAILLGVAAYMGWKVRAAWLWLGERATREREA